MKRDAENQLLTRKMTKNVKKLVKIFGQFVKKQYLCSRFRAYCK